MATGSVAASRTSAGVAVARKALGRLRGAPKLPLAIVLLYVFVGLFGPWLAPYDPTDIGTMQRHLPPMWMSGGSSAHILGTDPLGRDMLSRVLLGARVSLAVGLLATAMAFFIGTTLGLIAGYFGGWSEAVIMRVVDALLAFPALLIALIFAVTLGPSFTTVVLVLGLFSWSGYARLVRGQVLQLREKEFVLLAKVAGVSPVRILSRHILPNVISSVIVLMTLQIPGVILAEASLSFLGAGVPPPNPSWGGMISQGRNYVATAWWDSLFPGLAIAFLVLALNLFGDWLRDQWDPRLQGGGR